MKGLIASVILLGSGSVRADFTLIVLPDTQFYSRDTPEIFTAQTEWIVANVDAQNIVFVLHEGDIVHHNHGSNWRRAEPAMGLLDGVVPYVLNIGNHDMGLPCCDDGINRDTTLYKSYFPTSRYWGEPWFGGFMAEDEDNYFVTFQASGMDFLVISLEFGPDDAMLAWANQVLPAYPEHRVIVLTHAFLRYDDTLLVGDTPGSPHNYGINKTGANDAQEMWDEFVRFHANIFLLLCGHIGTETDGTGRTVMTGDNGNPIHVVLANYQKFENGGNGWLRIMRFAPQQDQVCVSTYSPWLGQFSSNPEDTFDLDYEMGVLGDLDNDFDVDLDDARQFLSCLDGPAEVPQPECEPADLNADQRVDLLDATLFFPRI